VFLIRFDNRDEDAEGNKVLKKRKKQPECDSSETYEDSPEKRPECNSNETNEEPPKKQRKLDSMHDRFADLLSKYAPIGDNEKPPSIYSGFECENDTYEWEGKTYVRCRIIVHSTRLAHEEIKSLERKMAKSADAIEKVIKRANKKKFANQELLFKAVEEAVSGHRSAPLQMNALFCQTHQQRHRCRMLRGHTQSPLPPSRPAGFCPLPS
jgi:hypothetical protein